MENQKINDKSEYGELFEFVAEQFGAVRKEIGDVKKELAAKSDKSDIENILSRINTTNDKIDDYRADQFTLGRKVERHEEWITKAAPKVGIDLVSD